MAGKQSAAMDKAQKAITSGRMNAQQAAAKYELAAISIMRKPWYREYVTQQTNKKVQS